MTELRLFPSRSFASCGFKVIDARLVHTNPLGLPPFHHLGVNGEEKKGIEMCGTMTLCLLIQSFNTYFNTNNSNSTYFNFNYSRFTNYFHCSKS